MRVVNSRPPNFDELNKKFHIAGKPIIFAWGDTIYNPLNISIPEHLMIHEQMHGWRQEEMGVESWWEEYIVNDAFRKQEEIMAHQVEYRHLMKGNRSQRRTALKRTARKLSAPLYGGIIELSEAREYLIQAGTLKHDA